jgi:hypothetical protein
MIPWPAPVPLVATRPPLPEVRLDAIIPDEAAWLREYLAECAAQVQVHPCLPAPMSLSLLSLAAGGAVEFVGRPSHVEIPGVWTTTLALPSERKSSTLRLLLGPWREPVQPTRATHEAAAAIEQFASRSMLGGDTPIQALIAADTTPAGIARAVQYRQGRQGIISDEGHVVAQFRQAVAQGGLDIFLKGWSGDALHIRRSKDSISLPRTAIVIALLVQPDVVTSMFTATELIGRGFPQRFLYSYPPPMPGTRRYAEVRELDPRLSQRWCEHTHDLLRLPRLSGVPRRIALSPDAFAIYAAYTDGLDQRRRDPDQSPFQQQWFSKAHGQALRIAGNLALAANVDTTVISAAAMQAATIWMDYFAAHTAALYISVGEADLLLFHARRVVHWLRQRCRSEVTRNEVTQSLRCNDMPVAADWTPVLDLLCHRHYLRPLIWQPGAGGGRPSSGYAVNPAMLTPVVPVSENPANPGNQP